MKTSTSLMLAALCIACSAAYAQPGPASPADQAIYAEAVDLYRAGRWSAAYGRFVRLADRGHEGSARIALLMLRQGRDLYGTEWSAAPSQVSSWERTVKGALPVRVAAVAE